jgi:beta-glucanase (GH16 family)
MIVSHGSFAQRYGYFELRAKPPRGKGLWPAFWLLPKRTGAWPPELDVMEQIGSQPHAVLMAQHYRDAAGVPGKHCRTWTGPDFTAGFHTFGLCWSPEAVVWYIDGWSGSAPSSTSPPRRVCAREPRRGRGRGG